MNRHKHSEIYMKRPFNKRYFEGWYFKQTDSRCINTISFIPSVSFSKKTGKAYIQVIYQNENEIINDICEYSISSFKPAARPFSVTIEQNCFSKEKIQLNFHGEKLSINGTIHFSGITELNSTLINPNIMGYFSYIPFMQCNHGILSMNHTLAGSLNINGTDISFDKGLGYMEKDWGSSFPREYIWLQCNHFTKKGTSLFFSAAHIPMLFRSFTGFICSLLLDGKQYRFATYTGAKVSTRAEKNQIEITIKSRNYKLKILAGPKQTRELRAPRNGEMNMKIKEALSGYLEMELKDINTDMPVYKDKSPHASMEIVNQLVQSAT